MYAGFSLLKVSAKFNSNGNGADTAHICQQSACLHTQKCADNVIKIITEKFTVNELIHDWFSVKTADVFLPTTILHTRF